VTRNAVADARKEFGERRGHAKVDRNFEKNEQGRGIGSFGIDTEWCREKCFRPDGKLLAPIGVFWLKRRQRTTWPRGWRPGA
jgi:hypothetical protein